MRSWLDSRRALVALLMTTLWLPLIQQRFPLVQLQPLGGRAVRDAPRPRFTWQAWFDGRFQDQATAFANQAFGFRDLLVRLDCQVAYSLFGRAKANGVVLGRAGHLYASGDVDAYTGADFVGNASLEARLAALVRVQRALAGRGVTFLPVLVPGKAALLPQHLDAVAPAPPLATQRGYLTRRAPTHGLDLLDLTPVFEAEARRTPYPLYPAHGMHWSVYGMHVGLAALMRELGARRGEPLPEPHIESVEWSRVPRASDDDLLQGMNLLFPLRAQALAYPRVRYEQDGRPGLRLLVVGDSFWWLPVRERVADALFGAHHFWFYYDELHDGRSGASARHAQVDLALELARQDVVVLLAADTNLARLGWGFIEDADALLTHGRVRPRAPVIERP
jgi:hypothetical protein